MKKLICAILAVCSCVGSAEARGAKMPAAVQGEWVVYANGLDPEDGVQAYMENDRRVVGARLVVAPDRISWKGRPDVFDDTCDRPSFVGSTAGFDFLCSGKERFGPERHAFSLARNGRLTLRWYDNLVLRLKKIR